MYTRARPGIEPAFCTQGEGQPHRAVLLPVSSRLLSMRSWCRLIASSERVLREECLASEGDGGACFTMDEEASRLRPPVGVRSLARASYGLGGLLT
mmetsp:Transcript_11983/g.26656  ORF Transcript_11983/g.26656 Transcript_11983/m.26656 type:complete len:96 (-) Transcript_11983:200-487(-)